MSTPEPAGTPPGEPPAAPPPPPPAPPAGAERVLRRSRDDKVIAGVCGGLGRYLGIDPVLLRIAMVILAIAGGTGILLYIVGWIVIPEERPGEDTGPAPAVAPGPGGFRLIVGGGLVLVGVLLLADEVLPDWFDDRYVWPVVLILIGLLVLTRSTRR